jgi:ribosomal protein S18 acetylase RimI-like enzyme
MATEIGIEIREAKPENAREIADCKVKSWRTAYKGIVPDDYLSKLSVERQADYIKKAIEAAKGDEYYVVLCDGLAVGMLAVCNCRDDDKPDAGEISAIYLVEEYRGMGYGSMAMNCAISRLRLRGYEEAVIWVLEQNRAARQFYEKHGFTPDGAKKDIELGKPLTAVRYSLWLK